MNFNVLVAEPCNQDWESIVSGIRHNLPHASILRVKDGEQALRFLFDRGLLTDDPEIPDLVLLAAELRGVPAERVLAQLRQDPRTCTTPVIVLSRDGTDADLPDEFRAPEGLVTISGTDALKARIAEAVRRLCGTQAYLPWP